MRSKQLSTDLGKHPILKNIHDTQAGDCDVFGPAVHLLIWHQEDTHPALSSKIPVVTGS
jgi:hypothetical protein